MSTLAAAIAVSATTALTGTAASAGPPAPKLEGRAVLPVNTYAPGPPAGAYYTGPPNGITFPTPSQPVEGVSAVIAGRHKGEYLAMPDNGFGTKDNSRDFLIRAYYIEPHFKTAHGGSGTVKVEDFIEFRDPWEKIGFPIQNESTLHRRLTGGDIDPESLQRAKNGDYWMGDEFGPWLLHFDAKGILLEAPIPVPGDLKSPSNPLLDGDPPTHPGSRGIEAMAMTPDGKRLIVALEGATNAQAGTTTRQVFEFDVSRRQFTTAGPRWTYLTQDPAYLVADMAALDQHRLVVIERDGPVVFRRVYVVDLRRVGPDGSLEKHEVLDLTAIPDPDLVSLPAIHEGDVGLGNPFKVMCESIEAVRVLDGERLLLGCDNNFPNKGRNPNLADDTELIVVKVPGLKSPR
jgi:glycerophosphoryl diester phosphodiesterase